jgi:hypothetical protein
MIRIFLLEDDVDVVTAVTRRIESTASDLEAEIDVTAVTNRDDALRAIEAAGFFADLAIVDLRVPAHAGTTIADSEYGMQVADRLLSIAHGTKTIVFSAHGSGDIAGRLMDQTWASDPLGLGDDEPMLEFVPKERLPDCLSRIERYVRELDSLEKIEVAFGPERFDLDPRHKRALQIFARRQAARVVRLSPLSGGLSDAITVRVEVFRGAQSPVAVVVAKLLELDDVRRERQAYDAHISPRLDLGTFAHVASYVVAGAAGQGGIFYKLAIESAVPLHERLVAGDSDSAEVVKRLQQLAHDWQRARVARRMTVGEIRNRLVSDSHLGAYEDELRTLPRSDAEDISVEVFSCSQHGDLHAFNVLVEPDGSPILIDFALAGDAPASLDPVTLELSFVFHPSVASIGTTWPSPRQAEGWRDLTSYLVDCPRPDFIRACREWAYGVAAGDREVAANVYAYALRQLRFGASVDLAVAYARGALAELSR